MADGVPIRVVIGLRPNGHADHPDWTTLPLAASGVTKEDKEHLVKAQQIVTWVYDKASGHAEETADSPAGQQLGMLVVSQQFADEAVLTFPSLVTVMTEPEAQVFWESKGHAHMPEENIDQSRLQALKAQKDLLDSLQVSAQVKQENDSRIMKALDPDDAEPGVRRNTDKSWTEAKLRRGFGIL